MKRQETKTAPSKIVTPTPPQRQYPLERPNSEENKKEKPQEKEKKEISNQ